MTQSLYRRLALGLATAASIACLPAAASAADPVPINTILGFKGTATDIGVQRGLNQIGGIEYRIEGKFEYAGPMNLTNSTITFHNLLDEEDGNGEMVLTTDNAVLVCPRDPEDPPDPRTLPSLNASRSRVSMPLFSPRAAARESRPRCADAGPVPAAEVRVRG